MTQTQWDARVAARNTACGGCLWQYFKMDDASGFPQDSSGNGADITSIAAGQSLQYEQAGPFSGAESIHVDGNGGNAFSGLTSAVVNPPTNTVNYGHPKTIELWFKPTATPGDEYTILAAGNIAIVMYSDRKVAIGRYANPNTFSAKSTTALTLDEWYFLMATSIVGASDMNLYVNETLEVTTTSDALPWPVPNGSLLRVGSLPEFGEEWSCVEGYYSNMALYDAGDLEPDLPHTPQLVSMNAVIPTAGT